MIFVHGRTKKDGYKAPVDYDAIKIIKENVKIPIIANGDINNYEKAKQVLNYTKANGIMIGRAAIGKAWIFYQISTGQKNISQKLKKKIILEHLDSMIEHYKEHGIIMFRKHLHTYSKGYNNANSFRESINTITNEKELKKIFLLNNITHLYNPANIKFYISRSKEPLEQKYQNIFKNSFVFINIGRLTEAKGQWFLIRSFKEVVEKYPNAKLIILGEGELKEKLQDLINKLNLQNNVHLLGMQKNPFKFLKHSNCFVFPSLWEGLPNTVIEALSLNIPIISADCKTGPREILCPELNIDNNIDYPYFGKYGILTKPFPRMFIWEDLDEKPLIEEEKKLFDLMIKMIEDENLKTRYSNGLERAKDFDIGKISKEWEKLLGGTL